VQTVDWYDCVKWCNARSQPAGLTPVYYTDAALPQVYTNGEVDITNTNVNWTANGCRLLAEAEWEKAARGGLSGLRFPWGNTIDWSHANYYSSWSGGAHIFSYDLAPASGYDPVFKNTSPAGSFAANGYGLYDLAGNVEEWCWDWYDDNLGSEGSPYAGGNDPRGPDSSPYGLRVVRGGVWNDAANLTRCASRENDFDPHSAAGGIGFRCVRGL
jgi:sulfatase modifying factor 1